ncbi:hypothetical protein D0Z03_000270 [Geotrichum reessii]|nr:hypothetical protein D0Z03_000270 [Galactomyces reessii]
MAVAQLPSYELAVELYDSLVELRQQRDVTKRDLANSWRKRNYEGNIWNSGQYRPTYTQEAVADLAEVLNAFNTESTVYWESQWRRGDDKYWGSLIKHDDLPKFNPRDSYVVLRALGTKHFEEFKALKAKEVAQQQETSSAETVSA